jgi:hypothetical protein
MKAAISFFAIHVWDDSIKVMIAISHSKDDKKNSKEKIWLK